MILTPKQVNDILRAAEADIRAADTIEKQSALVMLISDCKTALQFFESIAEHDKAIARAVTKRDECVFEIGRLRQRIAK